MKVPYLAVFKKSPVALSIVVIFKIPTFE